MSNAEIVTFIIAMPAITNPIGNMAIFPGLTGDKTLEEKTAPSLSSWDCNINNTHNRYVVWRSAS